MITIRSKAQARLFGLVAGGERVIPGVTQQDARDALRGIDMDALPENDRSPTNPYPERRRQLRKPKGQSHG